MDQQLAQNMSSRGVGLADIMYKQLSRSVSAAVLPEKLPASSPIVAANMEKAASALPSAYSENFQQGFVQRMTPHALQASRETGVPAPLMLGQAALESGWGRREIKLPDGGNSYNLFGIKATGNWHGKVAEVTTTEYQNGIAHKQVEKFRAYGSYAEAFNDYAHLLRDNPRYASVVREGQSAPAAAHALQRAGYATDPNYADKLVKVMNRINILGG